MITAATDGVLGCLFSLFGLSRYGQLSHVTLVKQIQGALSLNAFFSSQILLLRWSNSFWPEFTCLRIWKNHF